MIFRRRGKSESDATTTRRAEGPRSGKADRNATIEVMQSALEAVPVGIVVRSRHGKELAANTLGTTPTGDYQADALLRAAVDRVIANAASGDWEPETLHVHGPTPRSFQLYPKALPEGGKAVITVETSERTRLDAIRRDFVANVSHELRTPVGAIVVLAETLMGETDPESTRLLHQHLVDEAKRAERLVEKVLALSRVETSDPPQHVKLPIGDVVGTAVERMIGVAQRQGIAVSFDAPDDNIFVKGDRDQLTSAVANLLENAIKYSDGGSAVVVSAALFDGEVSVIVRDEGIGIPANEVDRVFERFYRVDSSRSRETGGAGLGLAIVRHVVENHGGRIAVQSREGQGSTFTMIVPAAS